MVQELAQGDARSGILIGQGRIRQVGSSRDIQRQSTLLHELHHREGRERLAHRAQGEEGPAVHRGPAWTGITEGLQVDRAVGIHNRQGQARHVVFLHDPLHVTLHLGQPTRLFSLRLGGAKQEQGQG